VRMLGVAQSRESVERVDRREAGVAGPDADIKPHLLAM